MRALTTLMCAVALAAASAVGVHATERHPPASMQLAQDDDANGAPEQGGSVAALTVRIDRMESTIRSLTGQIEELQFQNRKLTDDLRKMQDDVDFRFQDLNRGGGAPAKPAKRSDADPGGPATSAAPDANGAAPAVVDGATTSPRLRRTSDAFDAAANPGAPGAPRPLGSTAPSAPLPGSPATQRQADAAPNAPLDLMRQQPQPSPDAAAGTAPEVVQVPRPAPNPNAVASLAPGGTRDEYNGDLDLYKQGQYDSAATGLKSFVDKYPRDKLVPDAVYLLGEAYTKLGRHREAAEQYLRLSTDFSKAPRAPDALLRLGMSLNAMGVKEQACATYEEVTRRYPTASPEVRAGVDRELKRARC